MRRDNGHPLKYYVEKYNEAPPVEALATGLDGLDEMLTGGLIPGEIVTVAAKTGEGKTSFGLTLALNVAQNGVPVSILSFEMSMPAVHARLNQMVTGVSSRKIQRKIYDSKKEEKAVDKGNEHLSNLDIICRFGHDLTPENLYGIIEKQIGEHGIGLVIIDYVQLVGRGGEFQTHEVGKTMKSVMNIAGSFRIPVITLAQYNRSVGEEPSIRSIKDSSSIEQNSQTIILLKPHHDKPWQDRIPFDFMIKKDRNGEGGTTVEYFNPTFARFENG